MTRLGWNPNGAFTRALTETVSRTKPAEMHEAAGNHPHPRLCETGIHRSTAPGSPTLA